MHFIVFPTVLRIAFEEENTLGMFGMIGMFFLFTFII